MNSRLIATTIAFGLLLFGSCRREFQSPEWDVDALTPIARGHVSIFDLLSDDALTEDPSGLARIHYRDQLLGFKVDSLYKIPDTTNTDEYIFPFDLTVPPGQVLIEDTQNVELTLDGIGLVTARLKEGKVTMVVESTIPEKTVFEFDLPGATLNGIPFHFADTLPPGTSSSPSTFTTTLDLAGYELDLRGVNLDKVNTLKSTSVAYIDPNGGVTTVPANSAVTFSRVFEGFLPEYGKGFFDRRDESYGPDFTSIGVMNNFGTGVLMLDDATMDLTITNETGLDFQLLISELISINNRNLNNVDLDHSVTRAPININRALDLGQTAADIKPYVTQIELNSNNSNITDFIGNLPDQLRYSLDMVVNPLGANSGGNDFIYYQTGVAVDAVVDIPLRLSINDLELHDTSRVILTDTLDPNISERVLEGDLIINIDNDFPVNSLAQFYLVDFNNQIFDSLLSEPTVIQGGIPDASTGRVTERAETTLTTPLSEEKIDQLYRASAVLYKITFNTTTSNSVAFYADYRMNIQINADFRYRFDADEL